MEEIEDMEGMAQKGEEKWNEKSAYRLMTRRSPL